MSNPTPSIWQVNGPFWKIPVYAEVHDTIATFSPPFPLLLIQQKEFHQLILNAGGIVWTESASGVTYQIALDLLKIIATKCKQVHDVETLLIWSPHESRDAFDVLPDMKAFIRQYIAGGSPFPEYLVTGVWHGVCKWALHCLVNLHQPVPMGFCTLHPVLMAPGWKNRLYAEYDSKKPIAWTLNRIVAAMLQGKIQASQLLKTKQGEPSSRVIRWYLEVEQSHPFQTSMVNAEKLRLKQYGKINYWKHNAMWLKGQAVLAVRLFAQYVVEKEHQGNAISAQLSGSDIGQVFDRTMVGKSKDRLQRGPTDAGYYDWIEGIPEAWSTALQELHEVPTDGQEMADVRDSVPNQHVEGPWPGTPTRWLSLPVQCDGAVSGEGLLAGSSDQR